MNKQTVTFLSVLAVITFLGFAGYYFGFLGFIYKVMMPEAFGNFPLIILSVIFGIAAFFSPCSLTVLPSYVSHYLSQEGEDRKSDIAKGLYFGLIAALGVISVNLVIGLIIGLLGSTAPFAKDPRQDIPIILGLRTVAGFLIAYLGLLTVLGKHIDIPFIQTFIGTKSREVGKSGFTRSIFLYGVLYNGAAIGCTGPILLGLTLYALTRGSFSGAFSAFLVFALTMGILMVILTTTITLFQRTLVKRLMPFTPLIRQTAGWVMIITGATIAFLTLEGNRLFVKLFFPFLR